MRVSELLSLLMQYDSDLPVTVLGVHGGVVEEELPLVALPHTVTVGGGGAAPLFVAINVEVA